MEDIVKLKISPGVDIDDFKRFSKIFKYLLAVRIILFDDQFDDIGASLSSNEKVLLKTYSQKHSEFLSETQSSLVTDSIIDVVFVGGWGTRSALADLEKMFIAFNIENVEIEQQRF